MASPLQLQFVLSAPSLGALPDATAEVAIIGRSNVGKSSLVNSLANRKSLAHTSNTPGRTQLLNLFQLPNGTTVMDLPGYGYSAVPGRTRAQWPAMIEGYLLGRRNLQRILVLVDAEVGPTKLDVQTLEWLRFHELVFTVVATKHDKVKSSTRPKRKAELTQGCGVAASDVVWVSAAKGTGIDELRGLVKKWLNEK